MSALGKIGRATIVLLILVLSVALGISLSLYSTATARTTTQTTSIFSTRTVISSISTTFTTTVSGSQQYPITFVGTPTYCSIVYGLCLNTTLVSHLGENVSVVLVALFQNATTGQNVTEGASECIATVSTPVPCYVVASAHSTGTYMATLYVVGLDGKIVLSPSISITFTVP